MTCRLITSIRLGESDDGGAPGAARAAMAADQPEPRRDRHREPADRAHEDRHEPGDEGGRGGHHRDRLDHIVSASHIQAVHVLGGADDEGIKYDDVGHREEGDETTSDLAAVGRPAGRQREPAVNATRVAGWSGNSHGSSGWTR